ncbi:hypothetical protein SAMN05192541_12062 [Bradyrhizobium arachidis]|jgi:hypothetical protein|nr:hypothetical protein SAMN05192541_12062 [Bradyrhizobium arachidis]
MASTRKKSGAWSDPKPQCRDIPFIGRRDGIRRAPRLRLLPAQALTFVYGVPSFG